MMPICMEAGEPVAVVLYSDESKENPPLFWTTAKSMRDQRALAKVSETWDSDLEMGIEDRFDAAIKLFFEQVTNWDHITKDGKPVEFSRDNIEDVLTYQEIREIIRKVYSNVHYLNHSEKKSSE